MNRAMPLFPLLGLTFVAVFCWAAEPDLLDPNLSYQAVRTNPVTYDVDFSAAYRSGTVRRAA